MQFHLFDILQICKLALDLMKYSSDFPGNQPLRLHRSIYNYSTKYDIGYLCSSWRFIPHGIACVRCRFSSISHRLLIILSRMIYTCSGHSKRLLIVSMALLRSLSLLTILTHILVRISILPTLATCLTILSRGPVAIWSWVSLNQ